MNMRPVKAARALAEQLMEQYGLTVLGWEFYFNNNKRTLGLCIYPFKGKPGRIELSIYYAANNPIELVRDTILHEIAHALTGPGHGHNDVWKAACVSIGARPVRCKDAGEVELPAGNYTALCPTCKTMYHRQCRPKQMEGWWCRRCGQERGKLVWKKT